MISFPEDPAAFEQMVRALMVQEKISFIRAVYRIVDQLTEQKLEEDGVGIACRKGCSVCCHQMVTCTEPEWQEIKAFITVKERARKLKKHFLKAVRN